jgi:hypothetical protein
LSPSTPLLVTNTASDTDIPTPVLTYSLVDPPAGATIDSNGVITWNPDEETDSSTNLFVTMVTDNGIPAMRATNSFSVVVIVPPVPPEIQSIVASGNIVTITWTTRSNHIYKLQYKTSMIDTVWMDLGPDVTATGLTTGATDAIISGSNRFYRVVLLP